MPTIDIKSDIFLSHLSNLIRKPIEIQYTGNHYLTLELSDFIQYSELLVQECAKIAQGDRGGDEYWRARASARADILKHFGIANLEFLGDNV
jgi:hypothetical protein